MSRKRNDLIQYLQDTAADWVPASKLSAVLGVSERQIRNYIASANKEALVIQSSPRGYRLNRTLFSQLPPARADADTPQRRQRELLFQLLNAAPSSGIDVYDAAEALYISDSTLENDLQHLRAIVSAFDLQISRKKDACFLLGTEENKRRLIRIHIYGNSWNTFLSSRRLPAALAQKFPGLLRSLKESVRKNALYINDYSLAQLSLRTGIRIWRIRGGFLSKNAQEIAAPPLFTRAALDIRRSIEKAYAISLSDFEQSLLCKDLLVTASYQDPAQVVPENLPQYVEEKYIHITQDVIRKVQERYPIARFDDNFYVKFTLHLKSCFMRRDMADSSISPLDRKIKYSYPLIHDISVYIADILERNYGLPVSDGEITYIAFHLCTCLSSHSEYQVTVTYIYSDYWGYHQKILEQIIRALGEKGIIRHVVSISDYYPGSYSADLTISDTDMAFQGEFVLISSLPSSNDFACIQQAVEKLFSKKQYYFFQKHFLRFFDSRCFLLSPETDSSQLLREMCAQAAGFGLISEDFYPDVLKREALSGTAFHEVAVPHSLTANALRSFISIAIPRSPILWEGQKNVRLILLLGVQESDRKIFSHIFDFLVDILSDSANVRKLASASSFSEFLKFLDELAHT